jgi:hypothetical protein
MGKKDCEKKKKRVDSCCKCVKIYQKDLPVTLTRANNYCLGEDLAWTSPGAPIKVTSNNVKLDFGSHQLDLSGAAFTHLTTITGNLPAGATKNVPFEITDPTTTRIRIVTGWDSLATDIDVTVFDPTGKLVGTAASFSNPEIVTVNTSSANQIVGTWTIVLESFAGPAANYTIDISTTGAAFIGIDANGVKNLKLINVNITGTDGDTQPLANLYTGILIQNSSKIVLEGLSTYKIGTPFSIINTNNIVNKAYNIFNAIPGAFSYNNCNGIKAVDGTVVDCSNNHTNSKNVRILSTTSTSTLINTIRNISLSSCTNVIIRGSKILQTHLETAVYTGIAWAQCSNIEVDDCTVDVRSQNQCFGIANFFSPFGGSASNTWIHHCQVRMGGNIDNAGWAINFNNVSYKNILVEHCQIEGATFGISNWNYGASADPSTVTGIVQRNNNITNCQYGFYIPQVTDSVISGNNVSKSTVGYAALLSVNTAFENNTAVGCGYGFSDTEPVSTFISGPYDPIANQSTNTLFLNSISLSNTVPFFTVSQTTTNINPIIAGAVVVTASDAAEKTTDVVDDVVKSSLATNLSSFNCKKLQRILIDQI